MRNVFFCHNVFKKSSAEGVLESVYMLERVKPTILINHHYLHQQTKVHRSFNVFVRLRKYLEFCYNIIIVLTL